MGPCGGLGGLEAEVSEGHPISFTLVAKESSVSPSAKWFATLVTFAGLSTVLLLSSNSSELSPMIANT
jgi:hypothetical protein